VDIANHRRFFLAVTIGLILLVAIVLGLWLVFFQSSSSGTKTVAPALDKSIGYSAPRPVAQAVAASLKAPTFLITIQGASPISYYVDQPAATTAIYQHGQLNSLTISNVLYTPTKHSCFVVVPTGSVSGSSYLRGLLPFLIPTTTYTYPNASTIAWTDSPSNTPVLSSAPSTTTSATSTVAPHGVIHLDSNHRIISGTNYVIGRSESFTVNYRPSQHFSAPPRCPPTAQTTTSAHVVVTTDSLPTTKTTKTTAATTTPATSSSQAP
jgi:hypothetical protein